MKKRILVADKRACGATRASVPRQQGIHWEAPGAGHAQVGTYVPLSEGELFPGDSGGLAWPGLTGEPAPRFQFKVA
jgi:hypothetical protein